MVPPPPLPLPKSGPAALTASPGRRRSEWQPEQPMGSAAGALPANRRRGRDFGPCGEGGGMRWGGGAPAPASVGRGWRHGPEKPRPRGQNAEGAPAEGRGGFYATSPSSSGCVVREESRAAADVVAARCAHPFFPVALPSTEPSKTLPQSFLRIKWGFPKAFLQLGLLGLG